MKVCVFRYSHTRSRRLADALDEGVKRMGWELVATNNPDEVKSCGADVLACYGWVNEPLFDFYRQSGRSFLYLDLGYWSRKNGNGDYSGYHKVVLNARHATGYFERDRPGDRLEDAPELLPWREPGEHIVLAGMSDKSAPASGYRPHQWEEKTIAAIRKLSNRPIVYRPKPNRIRPGRPIAGTRFSGATETIRDALKGAYGLVTLHSNAAIDALAFGLPFHASQGLAASVSCGSLTELFQNPRLDIDRETFLRRVSYCHWTRFEIENGTMFDQFKSDGLLP